MGRECHGDDNVEGVIYDDEDHDNDDNDVDEVMSEKDMIEQGNRHIFFTNQQWLYLNAFIKKPSFELQASINHFDLKIMGKPFCDISPVCLTYDWLHHAATIPHSILKAYGIFRGLFWTQK